jgi:hypothetical protein
MMRATLGPYEAPNKMVDPRSGVIGQRGEDFGSRLRRSRCPDCRATVMVHHYSGSPLVWKESWLPPQFVPLDDGSFGISTRGGTFRDRKVQRPEAYPARVHCPTRSCNRLTLQVDDPRAASA